MATMALSGKPSHFAVLKIETSSDEDNNDPEDKNEIKRKSKNAKRKEKKKKKAAEASAADKELRGKAFMNPSKSSSGTSNNTQRKPMSNTGDDINQSENLDDDMKEAIRLSLTSSRTSANENLKSNLKTVMNPDLNVDESLSATHATSSACQNVFGDGREQIKVLKTVPPPGMKENDQSQNIESLQKLLVKKDKEITMLKTSLTTTKASLNEVKQRNSQLCLMLAHGEMKSKEELLIRVQELTAKISLLTGESVLNPV